MCFLASLAYSIIIADSFTSLAQSFNLPAVLSSRSNIIILLAVESRVISRNTHQIWIGFMLVVKALYLQNLTDQQGSKETYKYIRDFFLENLQVFSPKDGSGLFL